MAAPGMQQGFASRLRGGGLTGLPRENFVVFDRPGTYEWRPPRGALMVWCYAMGAGGGGGSGRVGLAATIRCGGGGGAGGGSVLVPIFIPYLDSLGSFFNAGAAWTIVVGAGGIGGAANSTASTNGNNGVAGSASAIQWATTANLNAGALAQLTAPGGSFGFGGTATTGTGGSAV
ncbi:MAG: hypothetical protein RJA49_2051, partial [Actinomycetota bacterium]